METVFVITKETNNPNGQFSEVVGVAKDQKTAIEYMDKLIKEEKDNIKGCPGFEDGVTCEDESYTLVSEEDDFYYVSFDYNMFEVM